jgi:hypothetical protein
MGHSYRYCAGRKPYLSDAEVLTIEIFAEMFGHHTDAAIWRYMDAHWRNGFTKMSGHKAFVKQSANLIVEPADLNNLVFSHFFAPKEAVQITDSVPLPICHIARPSRCKSFAGEASFGYCAVKSNKNLTFV